MKFVEVWRPIPVSLGANGDEGGAGEGDEDESAGDALLPPHQQYRLVARYDMTMVEERLGKLGSEDPDASADALAYHLPRSALLLPGDCLALGVVGSVGVDTQAATGTLSS